MTDAEFFQLMQGTSGHTDGSWVGNPNIDSVGTPSTTGIAGQSNLFGLSPEMQQSLFGGTNAQGMQTQGVVPAAVGAGTALAQSWLGFQQYGLAKDAFSFQKEAFNKNFAMQEDAYNTAKANQQSSAAAQNA